MNAIQPNFTRSLEEIFTDPICYEVMTDPVVDSCGHTFERTSIVRWLQQHNTCPLSQYRIVENELATNFTVKNALDIINRNGGLVRNIEELNVNHQERDAVVRAVEILRPQTTAEMIGQCHEKFMVIQQINHILESFDRAIQSPDSSDLNLADKASQLLKLLRNSNLQPEVTWLGGRRGSASKM